MSRILFAVFAALMPVAGATAGEPLIVSQDGSGSFRGDDEKPILAAIAQAVKQGGGEILIRPGVYLLHKGIVIEKAQHVALRGVDAESVILKLPPVTFAEAATAAPAGATELHLRKMQNVAPGMRLHLDADGPPDAFTKKPRNYVLATVKAVAGDRVTLSAPLTHPVPEGTAMRHEDAPIDEGQMIEFGVDENGLYVGEDDEDDFDLDGDDDDLDEGFEDDGDLEDEE